MNPGKWLFTASVAFLSAAPWALANDDNSLSHTKRGANSPAVVEVPPAGMPDSGVSVTDESGNGMAKKSRFDEYSDANRRAHHGARHEWVTDDTVTFHSAAPEQPYFAFYGEDIPALRGLQLETALDRVHHVNQKEIDLAKLAESRAKSENVLNLAHRIRADHEMLDRKVIALADRRGITLERFQLSTWEKAVRDRLGKLSGLEFEHAFLRVDEREHEESTRMLRMVRNDLSDTETRNLINETIPKMTAHMNMPPENKARARVEEGEIGE
jgi:predicted outer membrane protein